MSLAPRGMPRDGRFANMSYGLRVLIVDDDADFAVTTAELLRLAGHLVRIAADGAAALSAAAAEPPDVALIDLCLPDQHGCEVARRLTESAADKRPLLVAVTGFDCKPAQRREVEAGFDLHLTKPVDPAFLRLLLARFGDFVAEKRLAPAPPTNE